MDSEDIKWPTLVLVGSPVRYPSSDEDEPTPMETNGVTENVQVGPPANLPNFADDPMDENFVLSVPNPANVAVSGIAEETVVYELMEAELTADTCVFEIPYVPCLEAEFGYFGFPGCCTRYTLKGLQFLSIDKEETFSPGSLPEGGYKIPTVPDLPSTLHWATEPVAKEELAIKDLPGYDRLKPKEVKVCLSCQITPLEFFQIKLSFGLWHMDLPLRGNNKQLDIRHLDSQRPSHVPLTKWKQLLLSLIKSGDKYFT